MDANQANPCLVCGRQPVAVNMPIGTFAIRCYGEFLCPAETQLRHTLYVQAPTQAEALLLWNKAQPAQGGAE